VKAAVDKLKNNKAPGPDGIPGEILKEGYKNMENRIYELIVQIWNEERIPSGWVEVLICPIHKKGDVQNYVRTLEGFHWLMLHTRYRQSCFMED